MRTIRSLLPAAPAFLAAFLIAAAPFMQAIHLAECACHGCQSCGHAHAAPAASLREHASHCRRHEGYAHHHKQTNKPRSEDGPARGGGGHHHDPSTCPICQMYMALAKGFTTSTPPAQVGVALTEHIRIAPRQTAPAREHLSTASPRAPPCC
jgi:hypothetical protein